MRSERIVYCLGLLNNSVKYSILGLLADREFVGESGLTTQKNEIDFIIRIKKMQNDQQPRSSTGTKSLSHLKLAWNNSRPQVNASSPV
ncbi:MAG: hypothetical protein IPL59_00945 [Candidatus Competibacteraceae bacterium]|nr:hypothetical protein [Candidatus Competibacteraceae bacterium]